MRGRYILDLKFMAIREIEDDLYVDEHKALYSKLIKFTDSPILRLDNDQYLCDVVTVNYAVIDGSEVRILDINPIIDTINVVIVEDNVLLDYHVENLKLLGFTLDSKPILEYNV
jgi:hypothetical protein